MFEEICRKNILAIAGAYAKATGLSLATIGRRFHGNQNIFMKMKADQRCCLTIWTYSDMITKFRKEWPTQAVWPQTRAIVIPLPEKKVGKPPRTV